MMDLTKAITGNTRVRYYDNRESLLEMAAAVSTRTWTPPLNATSAESLQSRANHRSSDSVSIEADAYAN